MVPATLLMQVAQWRPHACSKGDLIATNRRIAQPWICAAGLLLRAKNLTRNQASQSRRSRPYEQQNNNKRGARLCHGGMQPGSSGADDRT